MDMITGATKRTKVHKLFQMFRSNIQTEGKQCQKGGGQGKGYYRIIENRQAFVRTSWVNINTTEHKHKQGFATRACKFHVLVFSAVLNS